MSAAFEDTMKRLEEIVNKLESGEASLDESIKLFEEGSYAVGGSYLRVVRGTESYART